MKKNRTHYLIIGNSTAAIGGIEGIRDVDRDASVTVVAKESYHTYSRPLISYLLAGEVTEEGMYYRPKTFYQDMNVDALLSTEVKRIDPEQRVVTCADGDQVGYRELLVATGGTPVVPAMEGVDATGVFTFVSWDDCRALDRFLSNAAGRQLRAVVIGGGLIGIKVTEALVARGVTVTMVELEERILPLMLDEHAAKLAAGALEKAGVKVVCGVSAERVVTMNGAVAGVDLSAGVRLDCDMVVVAVGVRPQAEFTQDTAIEIERGILIDDSCRTSCDHIYAAGDVAQSRSPLPGEQGVLQTFSSAYRQGTVAGRNMAGVNADVRGEFAMNSVQIFGLPVISLGRAAVPGCDLEVLTKPDDKGERYKKIVLENGRIVGAMFVGDIDRAGIVTGLMRQGIDVSGMKNLLLTEEFGIVSLPADYRKHVVQGEGIEV